MLSSVLTRPEEAPALAELRPEPLADGVEPEEQIICCGIPGKRYLAFEGRRRNVRTDR